MNQFQDVFTIKITDSWMSSNQMGGHGAHEIIFRACLNHNGRWINYRHDLEPITWGNTYIQLYPEDDTIYYRHIDHEFDADDLPFQYVWREMEFNEYAPDGISIYYEPGPWVELQTPGYGGERNYPQHWNNVRPHWGFERLLTPRHFGENVFRSMEIIGDDNYYSFNMFKHEDNEPRLIRFQSLFRGYLSRKRHASAIERMRERMRRYRIRRASRTDNLNLPHFTDNLNIKF